MAAAFVSHHQVSPSSGCQRSWAQVEGGRLASGENPAPDFPVLVHGVGLGALPLLLLGDHCGGSVTFARDLSTFHAVARFQKRLRRHGQRAIYLCQTRSGPEPRADAITFPIRVYPGAAVWKRGLFQHLREGELLAISGGFRHSAGDQLCVAARATATDRADLSQLRDAGQRDGARGSAGGRKGKAAVWTLRSSVGSARGFRTQLTRCYAVGTMMDRALSQLGDGAPMVGVGGPRMLRRQDRPGQWVPMLLIGWLWTPGRCSEFPTLAVDGVSGGGRPDAGCPHLGGRDN